MATIADQKAEWLKLAAELSSQFCQLSDLAANLSNAWYLRTYQDGGGAAMTDTDAAAINCTGTQLQTLVNFMGEIGHLKSGAAVTSSNQYDAVLQASRRLTFTRWWPEAERT